MLQFCGFHGLLEMYFHSKWLVIGNFYAINKLTCLFYKDQGHFEIIFLHGNGDTYLTLFMSRVIFVTGNNLFSFYHNYLVYAHYMPLPFQFLVKQDLTRLTIMSSFPRNVLFFLKKCCPDVYFLKKEWLSGFLKHFILCFYKRKAPSYPPLFLFLTLKDAWKHNAWSGWFSPHVTRSYSQ